MNEIKSAIDFYTRHPISADIILTKVREERGHLDGLTPEDLFALDQDHYGGLTVNDVIAGLARIKEGSQVCDFCAGLGGPARYLAHRYGARVTGIELTPARVTGAAELTRRVGLGGKVQVVQGDVMNVPLPAASQDAVVSQEALLHVPDVRRVLGEAYRILKPGGRIAFSTWVAHRPLSLEDAELMWDGMAVQQLYDIAGFAGLLHDAGFVAIESEDLTADWAEILTHRLAMYERLRGETAAAGTPSGHDAFYRSYVRFVALVRSADLGGGRFGATKPG